ncbi:MAG: selenide, water dikinase SelD [Gammaproteobacteria bacterium]|nr:selenide, water dikinase SelD [Gammaproteobacteria bacterium]
MSNEIIRLTEFSHGAGCGCKIAPAVLDRILEGSKLDDFCENLLVGNHSKDDAAVYDMGNGEAVISTTDFFMPIVDDAFDFGQIAATNAISDIYAMGGEPIMAIAILGWPINKLDASIARKVIDGGRSTCLKAGISLAGGHSIDAPEPIFGLAVTGRVAIHQLKRNNTAQNGDHLYLTKPLGIGILTTAEKNNILLPEHQHIARDTMCKLNNIGRLLSSESGVTAMTDVTGFGLLGHLIEMCEGSNLMALLDSENIPVFDTIDHYLKKGAIPGGTKRNFESYGHKAGSLTEIQQQIFCDPQTSGGLLIAVRPDSCQTVENILHKHNIPVHCIGELKTTNKQPLVLVDDCNDS